MFYKNLSAKNIKREIWCIIPEWENKYMVSNLGRVKSLSRKVSYLSKKGNSVSYTLKEMMLSQCNCEGYLMVRFYNDAVERKWFVHILVARIFIENTNNDPQVNHKDGDRKNNVVTNLEWTTPLGNSKHAINVLNKQVGGYSMLGSDNPNARPVIQFSLSGVKVKEWDCISDANKELLIKSNHITDCCSGKLKQAYGFKWAYK